jgi:hypothetical protein
VVGSGANLSIRAALSIRETSSTGPVGAPAGDIGSTAIHFLGATTVSVGAPVDAPIIYASNQWQTITFQSGMQSIANSANALGTTADGGGYAANDSVSIQVYAFRTHTTGVKIYSAVAAESSVASSNDVFRVNWTWDAVPGAQGYRLLQNTNGAGYSNFVDVVANNYTDANTGWTPGSTVTPNTTITLSPSVQWNPTVGNPNNIATPWGILESIAFAINVPDGTGPFDFYLDNVQNGTTVFQDFEGALAGTSDYGFRAPSFSGSTSGNILNNPNVGAVSNGAADTGTKAFRIQFQWNGTNSSKWLRLTTSGVGNPMVDLSQPISMRVLMLPVGSSPIAPLGPVLTIAPSGPDVILDWSGTHRLLEAVNVEGPYTTNTTTTTGPLTIPSPTGQKFYRLKD